MVSPKISGEKSLIPEEWKKTKRNIQGIETYSTTTEQKHKQELKEEVIYSPIEPLKVLKKTVNNKEIEPVDNRTFIEGKNGERFYEGTDEFNKIMGIEIKHEKQPKKPKLKKHTKQYKEKNNLKYEKPPLSNGEENNELSENTKYQEEYSTLVESNISILAIQKEMIQKGIISKNDLGKFGEKTAMFIYEYHPNYYINSSEISVRNRALAIMNLEKNRFFEFSEEKIKKDFENILDSYSNEQSKINKEGKTVHPNIRNVNSYKMRLNSKKHFYGNVDGKSNPTIPLEGTAIANGLNYIPSKIKNLPKDNNIYVLKNKHNKFVLYYFLGGKLKIATYVSPGRSGMLTPGNIKNVKIRYNENELTHFSGAKESIRKKGDSYVGAVMPGAVPIPNPKNEGIYLHASLGSWSKKNKNYQGVNGTLASHGCVRMPPFYNMALLKYLKNLSSNLTILDNN